MDGVPKIVIAGVSQGSAKRPLLWNVMNNAVLPVSEEITIVGFADDVVVVVAAPGGYGRLRDGESGKDLDGESRVDPGGWRKRKWC